jgi:hypothetical protein
MNGAVWLVAACLLGQEPAAGPNALAVSDARDGSPGAVEVKSEMGKKFRLTEAVLVLDGQEVARRTAPPGKELERTFRLWASGDAPVQRSERVSIDGLLQPGEHALTVRLVFQGRNVGPFTYVDDYKYRAESGFAFETAPGAGPATIQVVARERPDPKLPLGVGPSLTIDPAPGSSATPVLPKPAQ